MKILALVPFAGSDKLVSMTQDCIEGLMQSELPVGVHVRVIAINNAASGSLNAKALDALASGRPGWDPVDELVDDKNYGFGVGVNRGLDYALIGERWPCDQILVFNNDLQFPRRDWLVELLKEVDGRYVISPRTDVTATPEACQPEPADKPAQRVGQVSAFCWLIPKPVIDAISARWTFPLFPPEFTNYGSDDAAAAILRKIYGSTPFKVVHRSWVRHLKAQTANELGVKAGTKALLAELKKWKSYNKLK